MLKNHKNPQVMDLSEMLVDASIDRVMAIDMDWCIIAWNLTSQLITGLPKIEIINKHLLAVFPFLEKDDEVVKAIQVAMQGKKSFLPSRPDLEHRSFYENHFIPLKDEDGNQVGVMNIMHDVSHRIKAERELQRLHVALKNKYDQLEKANAELAIFTSMTGRDLKEPVMKLYTGLEMLIQTEGKKLSDNSKGGLRRMQSSLSRINLLLDDILRFSASASFDEKFETLQLEVVLQQALTSLQDKIAEKRAIIESSSLPEYYGSKEMLNYLFSNIVDNALKFQPEGNIPAVKITHKIIPANAGTSPASGNAPFLCISFADNGIGFPPADNKRIFNMFERLHPRKQFAGAGIGLSICQKIAEAHGGYIDAESTGENGAVFHCYLAMQTKEYAALINS